MSHTRAWWVLRLKAYKLQRKFGRINVNVINEEFLLFITFQWKASSATCVKKRGLWCLQKVRFGTCSTPVLDGLFDWKLTNCNVSLTASMSMWLMKNFCFSLRSNEKRAVRHVWKSVFYSASKKCVLAHVAQLALDGNFEPVLTTAPKKAHDTGSVTAAADLLFFEF